MGTKGLFMTVRKVCVFLFFFFIFVGQKNLLGDQNAGSFGDSADVSSGSHKKKKSVFFVLILFSAALNRI